MSTPFPVPVTAAQVGRYFVTRYYPLLQHLPDLVYHFYTDASTMLRVDGPYKCSATSLREINELIMSLNYSRIEIDTAHALESWNRGVLVIVSGSVQVKNMSSRRKFVETFFLAPQVDGFFVLNDVFHFTDEEPVLHDPEILLPESILDSPVNNTSLVQEPDEEPVLHNPEVLLPESIPDSQVHSTSSIQEPDEEPVLHDPEVLLPESIPDSQVHSTSSIQEPDEEPVLHDPEVLLPESIPNSQVYSTSSIQEPVEEPVLHDLEALLPESIPDSQVHSTSSIQEPVPIYLMGDEIQAREFIPSADREENGQVDSHSSQGQPLQQVPGSENILGQLSIEESNGSLESAVTSFPDHQPTSIEEHTVEPPQKTYASVLRGAKGQSAPAAPSQPFVNMSAPSPRASGWKPWNHMAEAIAQEATGASNSFERSGADTAKDFSAVADEDEIRSAYVENFPPLVSKAEIEEEFKSCVGTASDCVAIRSSKDIGVCYAFVEFENMAGVHNAVKAGSAYVAGQHMYVEERRPNNNIPFQAGRGRGIGRGSFLTGAPRGRFGSQSFASRGGYNGLHQNYGRSRGTGYYTPIHHLDRTFTGNKLSRSGQDQSD